MTAEIFLILLTAFSTATSLITEAVKKLFDKMEMKYASNIIVLFVSVLVGGLGTIGYYIINNVEVTAANVACVVIMMVANWLGSMVGYDKVKQALTQFKK